MPNGPAINAQRPPACGIEYMAAAPRSGCPPEDFSESVCRKALSFHRQLPGYRPTPLVRLSGLARHWGVCDILVKDESDRFGLQSFKVLGGSYAVARLLCRKLATDMADFSYADLLSEPVRRRMGPMVFCTATDGNHGRGIAWTAQQLQQRCVVYMPKGSARCRVAAIRSHGAGVKVTDLNYDDTVRLARTEARQPGWYIVQDTAWEGYTRIPRWIMQGYATLCTEAADQMAEQGTSPTHVFIQAGVGSLAAAMLGCLLNRFPDPSPRFFIMEPENAACFFASAAAGDGNPRAVAGDLATIMAGLACGEPNPMAWDILHRFAHGYFRCRDFVAANGIRILAHPIEGDRAVEAGESGSVGIGVLDLLVNRGTCSDLKRALGIGPDARLLFFNTEGATDPENRRAILWRGNFSEPH